MTERDTPSTQTDLPRLEEPDPSSDVLTPGQPNDMINRRFDLRGRSLRQHAARGVITNSVFLVVLSALGFVRGFVLAHFLSRSDYGVWGLVMVSLTTLLWLKQVGISDKYIQQDDEDQELAFQKAFTLEFLFMMIWVALLLVAMPIFALVVYDEPKLLAPGLVMILMLPAGALQMPLWWYTRRMEFLKQRILTAVDPVVGFVVAVTCAALGAGYWALAAGVLSAMYSTAILSVIFSPYKLRFRYDKGTLHSYASFAWPLVIAGGASLVIPQAAVISVQADLGIAAVGAVFLAANVSTFTNSVDTVVSGTLYPAVCAVRNRSELLLESFVKSNRLALMWAVPFGLALTLFSSDLVTFGIGEKWRPAVILLQIFGISAALGHVGFNWDSYFRARAETRPIAVAAVVALVVFLATALPLLFLYGLPGFAVGVLLQGVAHLVCRAYFLRRLFHGFKFARHALRAFLPTIPAVGLVLVMRVAETSHRTLVMALIELAVYILITGVATWLLEGRLLREATAYVFSRQPAPAS